MSSSLNEKWNEVCELVASYDDVNQLEFNALMERVQPQAMTDGFLLVTVDNNFLKKRIEQSFTESFKKALGDIYGMPFIVDIDVDDSMGASAAAHVQSQTGRMPGQGAQAATHVQPQTEAAPGAQPEAALAKGAPATSEGAQSASPEKTGTPVQATPAVPVPASGTFRSLTFESFVIGESNRMAYSMAVQVAESPGHGALNPLFIYGRSGLGKTHLLRAIQNYINETQPQLVTVYADAEDIVSKYTEASLTRDIDKSSYKNFKVQYERADVLLIDDIQFLQGKTGTLDIVFQIFNKLTNQGKQIILSADRAPKNIDMEERYNSRFMQGATIDIQPPEIETKLAIVKNYIDEYRATAGDPGFSIPEDVQMYVAENSSSNIRELKGAITTLIYKTTISGNTNITVDEVASLIEHHFSHGMSRNVSVEDIQKEVEGFYKIKHSEMVGSSRSREVVYPRQVAMYLCRNLLDLPFNDIGKKFNRDHSTAMYAVKKFENLLLSNRDVKEEVEALKKKINEL